jgi:CheY-like chemotaxis protein
MTDEGSADTRATRALLIDDDPQIRRAYARMLASHGYDVTAADGATAALEALDSASFDIVITDLAMPHMNGIALIQEIRARGLEIPILLLSGSATPADEARAVELRVSACLYKPISREDLTTAIRTALTQTKMR